MAIDTSGVKLEDRPFEQVKEQAIDQLIMNYSHGIWSAEAFERRLDVATEAKTHQELVDLVADLSLQPDTQYQQQRERSFSPRYQAGEDKQNENIISVLSSNQHSGQWLVPAEIRVINVLGSVELDFSEAIFQHQHIVIRVNNWVGSLSILVPEEVNVVSNMFNIIGSAENRAPSMGGRQAPKIVIEGYSVLGSLEVSLKRTIKEKFVAFANQFRDVFGMGKQ
ncbi:DUF1707 SHOCT-like domain-containing protein [Lacimicrobium alkaliphilum]|uniref:Uncharacterized protein n=1 Tax=Lacimicrobium alkaliphilum TaxID=1526571 RepID=A0A0U2QKZ5_9ALTE|nr:LiaF domain-containing protein [Lacimicrobium alkaliphilum]ALS97963.1 hypothetical protein AT746_06575 [Lacimicrobium alkaliphilum]